MPFKRAGWLQRTIEDSSEVDDQFQCPLSGLVGCNTTLEGRMDIVFLFQCPLSGLVGCNLSDPLIFPRRERGLEQGEEFLDGSVLMQ